MVQGVKDHLEKGASFSDSHILLCCAEYGDIESTEMPLDLFPSNKKLAAINAKDLNGDTSLLVAASVRESSLFSERLIVIGADDKAANK